MTSTTSTPDDATKTLTVHCPACGSPVRVPVQVVDSGEVDPELLRSLERVAEAAEGIHEVLPDLPLSEGAHATRLRAAYNRLTDAISSLFDSLRKR